VLGRHVCHQWRVCVSVVSGFVKQQCGRNEFSCRSVCGRQLACGHAWPEVCHAGECPLAKRYVEPVTDIALCKVLLLIRVRVLLPVYMHKCVVFPGCALDLSLVLNQLLWAHLL
jgi:hypothetical protein